MTIYPITVATPACFGVCCPAHGTCSRYASAEGPAGATATATCDDNGTGERPLYLEAQQHEEARPCPAHA